MKDEAGEREEKEEKVEGSRDEVDEAAAQVTLPCRQPFPKGE